MTAQLTTGAVVELDSATGHKHPHLEILDGTEVVGHLPVHGILGEDGRLYSPATTSMQEALLAELKLANAPNGYQKNASGEVTKVLRLVDGVIQSYELTKTTDGTDTVYTPGAWA